jgi:hypothetical protein
MTDCPYCGIKLTARSLLRRKPEPSNLTSDHIFPLSRGGPDLAYNRTPACYACNTQKGDKTLLEWLQVLSVCADVRVAKVSAFMDSLPDWQKGVKPGHVLLTVRAEA